MIEVWKNIENYDGYQVSNFGRIKRKKDNYIFKENKNSRGYRTITLTKDKKEISVNVHRLVAKAFVPNPERKPFINHIDGNKMNNRADNLEWCTHSENMKHAYINGLEKQKGKKVIQFDKKMKIIKIWEKIRLAEKELNITQGKISMVCRGKRKTTGGYIWRYYE